MTNKIEAIPDSVKPSRPVKLPRNPGAFWRAFNRAARRLQKVNRQVEYLFDHYGPRYRVAMVRAIKRQKLAKYIYDVFSAECSARRARAKKRGRAAVVRFNAPWFYIRERQRLAQLQRQMEDAS